MKNRHLFRPPVDNIEEYRSRLINYRFNSIRNHQVDKVSHKIKRLFKILINKK